MVPRSPIGAGLPMPTWNPSSVLPLTSFSALSAALTGQQEGWELGNLLLSMSALDAKPCVEGIGQQRAEA